MKGKKILLEDKTASDGLKFTHLQLESTLAVPGADELWYHKAQHPSFWFFFKCQPPQIAKGENNISGVYCSNKTHCCH